KGTPQRPAGPPGLRCGRGRFACQNHVLDREGLPMSKAVVFFAPGLEECEGLLVVDILRRAGVEVTIAAVGGSKTVVSSHKVQIVADAMAGEIDPAGYDACILPGGIPGVNNLAADADVRRVTVACAEAGKIVAAICAGPTVLAGFGLLGGRQATVYPGMDDKMDGAVCTGSEDGGRQDHHRPRAGRRHPLCAGAG